MELLLLFLFIALFFSFICSMLESVLLSVTPSYVTLLKHKNIKYAKYLDKFKQKIDQPLAAILTLNTFAHTLGATGVGVQAQKLWGDAHLSLISGILTLLILIFSEIIPKTLGANYWKSLTKVTTYSLLVLIYSPLYPFIILSEFITKLFPKPKHSLNEMREELSAMVDYGKRKGALRDSETRILKNLIRFQFIKARNILTPRVVMHTASSDLSVKDFYSNYKVLPYSRIPVYSNKKNNITGYVLKEDILNQILAKNSNVKLSEIQRTILISVESTPIYKLYEKMTSQQQTISIIVDEYGTVAGLITMEDIIETILGLEIVDENDNIDDMQQYALELLKKRYPGSENLFPPT